jgi:hypothetical protein
VHRASPTTLVEAKHFDAACSKGGKEFVISIAVVAEAVDEDDLGNWFSVRLTTLLAELTGQEVGSQPSMSSCTGTCPQFGGFLRLRWAF